MDKRRVLAVALLAVAIVMATMGAVNAALVTTNVLRSWDDAFNRYENGNLTLFLDGQLQPFYAQMAFDTKSHADACGAGLNSAWAGDAEIGLYHTDTNGAAGFQSSQDWSMVKCSTFATNKYPAPADILTPCVSNIQPGDPGDLGCVLKGVPDQVVACSTGNCTNEIVTQFHVNTDLDCDGTQDATFASAGPLCMYWAAPKPPFAVPYWGGNIQVRYGTGQGGDKTINFGESPGRTQ